MLVAEKVLIHLVISLTDDHHMFSEFDALLQKVSITDWE